jgi:hypothetical protein
MRKIVLLVILAVFFSGCISATTTTNNFKNDGITLDSYSVTVVKPYAGSSTTIQFNVQNSIDKPTRNVEVSFFDLPGFKILKIDCGDGQKKDDHTCFYDKIDALDMRRFSISLQAPSSDLIKAPTEFPLSFSVKYDQTGYKQMNIPIIDDVTIHEPKTPYKESSASYGPVKVDFEAPVGRETKKGKSVIQEHWAVRDSMFQIKFKFSYQGDSSIGDIIPVNITKGNIHLEYTNVEIAKDLYCNFDGGGGQATANIDVDIPKTSSRSLVCNFNSASFSEPEKIATISVSYLYTYEFIRTETITVVPAE